MATRKTIPKSIRIDVWKRDCGISYEGKCNLCKSIVDVHTWECGHLVSVANGGTNSLSNLTVLCLSCNRSMGKQNYDDFKEEFYGNGELKRKKEEIRNRYLKMEESELTLLEDQYQKRREIIIDKYQSLISKEIEELIVRFEKLKINPEDAKPFNPFGFKLPWVKNSPIVMTSHSNIANPSNIKIPERKECIAFYADGKKKGQKCVAEAKYGNFCGVHKNRMGKK